MSTTLEVPVLVGERDIRIPGCKTIATTIDRVIPNPELPFHPTVPNVSLDFDQAVGMPVHDRMAIVIPAAGLLGPCGDLGGLLRAPMVWGVIISPRNEVWVVETEPTIGNAFGIRVTTEPGKCVISGQGTVANEEVARVGTTPVMHFDVKTVYDGAAAGKCTVGGSGNVSNTGWSVGVSASYTFGK
jgi:hypothetical protein